jgi:hypothetical protein
MPEELPTYKQVADVIVSPTDSIVLGLEDETAYVDSVEPENEIATVGDVDTQGVPAGGTAGQILAKVDGDDYNTEWVTSNVVYGGVDTDYVVGGGTTGTQPTFTGPPLFDGSYVKLGDLVHFRVNVSMTNITNFGTGQYYVTLPFDSKYTTFMRDGHLHDQSTNKEYSISGHVTAGSNQLMLYSTSSNGNEDFFTHNSPFTLNPADVFHIAGSYIADYSS